MTLQLELAPEEEQHITQRARAEGVPPEDYVRRLVARDLERQSQEARRQAGMALLKSWVAEADDATDEELRQADEEWRESMRGIDAHRFSSRLLFPELADGS